MSQRPFVTNCCLWSMFVLAPAAWAEEAPPASSFDSSNAQATATKPEVATEPEVMPRVELFVPSCKFLSERFRDSQAGGLLRHLSGLFVARMSGDGGGLTAEEVSDVLAVMGEWPDTSLGMATFAPNAEGRRRWLIRLAWPLDDLKSRVRKFLEMDALAETLEGVVLKDRAEGGFELAVNGETLATIVAGADDTSFVLADAAMNLSSAFYGMAESADQKDAPTNTVLYSRLNLVGTEKDSGALFGMEIPWVSNVYYQASVRDGGEWSERFGISWNALVGVGAKSMLKRAKRGFYVPREAFGALLVSSPMLQGTLDALGGLTPGTLMSKTGGLAGERVGPEVCLVLMPGVGILPFPEVNVQTRVKFSQAVLDDIRRDTEKTNSDRARDEKPPVWHETEVDGRTVFYHDGRSDGAQGMTPATYRKILFVDQRPDPEGTTREYLNIALSTTGVEDVVRRWTAPLADAERVALPAGEKTDGRGWLHWRQVYEHVHPWLNLMIAGVDPGAVLPSTEQVERDLADSTVQVSASFQGLMIRHRGPIPAGLLYLPVTLSSSLQEDQSGSSDLSRERIARERLKLFYANAVRFKKDVGRWPARVAELDGYIDFDGQPWLLHVQQSTRSAFRAGFKSMIGEEAEEEDEEEESEDEIDDSLFVITWNGSAWTLGIKPGTLDHLDRLFIDQDGNIHRVSRAADEETKDQAVPEEAETADAQSV